MAKLFHVKYKRPNGQWANSTCIWKGRRTDKFSYNKARQISGALRRTIGVKNVRIVAVPTPKPRPLTKRQREQHLIAKYLRGDLDAQHRLLYKLALVAQDLGHTLYVAEGKRTVAEQWKYWNAYKNGTGPVAAFPGTSKHTYGWAADVRKAPAKNSGNLGDIRGARKSMKKWGLCLPVRGETWHTEIGTRWLA